MPSMLRSGLTVAGLVAALALAVAFVPPDATAGEPASRAVVDNDFYWRTQASDCDESPPGYCNMDSLVKRCKVGDEVIGGAGWLTDGSGNKASLAVLDMVDHPYGRKGWQVTNPHGNFTSHWTVWVRVFCARTG